MNELLAAYEQSKREFWESAYLEAMRNPALTMTIAPASAADDALNAWIKRFTLPTDGVVPNEQAPDAT